LVVILNLPAALSLSLPPSFPVSELLLKIFRSKKSLFINTLITTSGDFPSRRNARESILFIGVAGEKAGHGRLGL